MILSTPVMTLTPCDSGTLTSENNLGTGTVWKTTNDFQAENTNWRSHLVQSLGWYLEAASFVAMVMMVEDIVTTILLHATSCQNITPVNSSVPNSWWSMWQSWLWCDTWDPDHGLEENPLPPLTTSSWVECLFAWRLVLGAWQEAISIRYFLRP